ncbi:hypothetical protein F5Y14DRAFT_460619 [Nemania sp. NC0429]|nr:hypothetical protein F5Y14DRAFT_460619 [Nemania sp. NC0429]
MTLLASGEAKGIFGNEEVYALSKMSTLGGMVAEPGSKAKFDSHDAMDMVYILKRLCRWLYLALHGNDCWTKRGMVDILAIRLYVIPEKTEACEALVHQGYEGKVDRKPTLVLTRASAVIRTFEHWKEISLNLMMPMILGSAGDSITGNLKTMLGYMLLAFGRYTHSSGEDNDDGLDLEKFAAQCARDYWEPAVCVDLVEDVRDRLFVRRVRDCAIVEHKGGSVSGRAVDDIFDHRRHNVRQDPKACNILPVVTVEEVRLAAELGMPLEVALAALQYSNLKIYPILKEAVAFDFGIIDLSNIWPHIAALSRGLKSLKSMQYGKKLYVDKGKDKSRPMHSVEEISLAVEKV